MKKIIIYLLCIFLLSSCRKPSFHGQNPEAFYIRKDMIALCVAISKYNDKKVDKLIGSGLDINGTGINNKMVPLLWSMGSSNKYAFKKLLEKGADPNIILDRQDTVMSYSAQMEDPEYLKLAIKHGGDVNLVSKKTIRTPIYGAILTRSPENVKTLIKHGANLNFQDFSGYPPIITAANINAYDIVLILLDNGADPFLKTNNGSTIAYPIELSYETMDREHHLFKDMVKVIRILKKRGMKFNLKEPRRYRGKWKDGEQIK